MIAKLVKYLMTQLFKDFKRKDKMKIEEKGE